MAPPAILLQLKAMGMKDLYHIQGFMQLLMKPRNGTPWTPEDKTAIRTHLKSLSSLRLLAIFTLPGGSLLLPLLAWHLDRRRKNTILSISPDSIKSPAKPQAESTEPAPSPQP
jgi:hypothetical protein